MRRLDALEARDEQFFKITLPLMRSTIFVGATLVFLWSFTELGVP
jgi:iron(III) transport system permease protein